MFSHPFKKAWDGIKASPTPCRVILLIYRGVFTCCRLFYRLRQQVFPDVLRMHLPDAVIALMQWRIFSGF
jgi:hypothetical protein